jgi:hypothetical protein
MKDVTCYSPYMADALSGNGYAALMRPDEEGGWVAYGDYLALRARVAAIEAELKAFREDVEGAERRTLSFAMACVRGVDGITVSGALEMQRDEIAKLRAELKALREQEPVAEIADNYGHVEWDVDAISAWYYPVGTKLYAAPVPAKVQDDVARDAARYQWLRNGGWEVMQDPKYWTPERRFDGAIEAGMAEVKSNAMLAAANWGGDAAQRQGGSE